MCQVFIYIGFCVIFGLNASGFCLYTFLRKFFQAYTVELESIVTQLEEENARLLGEQVLFWLVVISCYCLLSTHKL